MIGSVIRVEIAVGVRVELPLMLRPKLPAAHMQNLLFERPTAGTLVPLHLVQVELKIGH
jgi:hypothetical protein